MPILKYFLRLQYMDFLIRRSATGDAETFARKNKLSKRALSDIIREMKEMGFPIKYDKGKCSYCYVRSGLMVQKLFIEDAEVLTAPELKNINLSDVHNLCFSEVSIFEPCQKP